MSLHDATRYASYSQTEIFHLSFALSVADCPVVNTKRCGGKTNYRVYSPEW